MKQIIYYNEINLISKPLKYLRYFITSSNEFEDSELNNLKAFKRHVKDIRKELKRN